MKFVEYPHEDTFDYEVRRTCRNCGEEFSGRYCNRCGEKVIVDDDRSLPVFLRKIFRTIPILDNKFTRTLRLMLTRPGFVARNYVDGRRIPFVNPLAIFLVINFLYFFFPTHQTFNSSLRTQMHFQLHKETATDMVERHIAGQGITLDEFTENYDLHAANVAKMMLVSFTLIMALPFWIANSSSGLYFRDHLLVSLEFCSMSVLINNLVIPWTWIGITGLFGYSRPESKELFNPFISFALFAAVGLALFYFNERRVYEQSRRRSVFLSFLLLAGLFISLHLYYGVVFFVSMWTL